MKSITTTILLIFSTLLFAQEETYYNEWIDFNQTYYKFYVEEEGLYRIPYSVLQEAGLAANAPEGFHLFSRGQEISIHLSSNNELNNEDYIIGNTSDQKLHSNIDAQSIVDKLYELNIQSIIIEGGSKTLNLFIKENLWDEARILTGMQAFDFGTKAPKISGKEVQKYIFGKDNIRIIKNELTPI